MEGPRDQGPKSPKKCRGGERGGRRGGMMHFLSFLALLGKFKNKNLFLNVFVLFFSVFLFLNPFFWF